MAAQSLRARFASAKEMENYFRNQDQEQEKIRYYIRAKWTRQNSDFTNIMNDRHDIFHDNNM